VVRRIWGLALVPLDLSILVGAENLGGLALVPLDLSILVGAEDLGFAVVPMAILSARFVERGRFHGRSRHFFLGTFG
jgi:hypothetical protein